MLNRNCIIICYTFKNMNYIILISLVFFVSSTCTYSQQINILKSSESKFDKDVLIKREYYPQIQKTNLFGHYRSGKIHNSMLNYSESIFSDYQNEEIENSTKYNIKNITVELLAGGLSGLLVGSFFYDNIDKNVEEDIIGLMFNSVIAITSTLIATSGAVYFFGNLLEDKGSFKKTTLASLLGAGITSSLSEFVDDKNKDLRLGIIFIGIPIGAVCGFNTSIK